MCLVYSTRCRSGLKMLAENIHLQLPHCTSVQGAVPRVSSFTHLCFVLFFLGGGEVWRIEGSLKKSAKGPLTCLCNGEKGFALVKSPYLQCFLALGGHVICGHCFYYLATVQEFSSRLLPFWVMRDRIIDHW